MNSNRDSNQQFTPINETSQWRYRNLGTNAEISIGGYRSQQHTQWSHQWNVLSSIQNVKHRPDDVHCAMTKSNDSALLLKLCTILFQIGHWKFRWHPLLKLRSVPLISVNLWFANNPIWTIDDYDWWKCATGNSPVSKDFVIFLQNFLS